MALVAALGRVETLGGGRFCRITGEGLSPAMSCQSPTDPDSGHSCGKVCCTAIYRLDRITHNAACWFSCFAILYCSSYF